MKLKITLIYTVVAILSAGIIYTFVKIASSMQKKATNERLIDSIQVEKNLAKYYHTIKLKSSIQGIIQQGKSYTIPNDLKDKIVIMHQFYAACPQCESINFIFLKKLYQKFSNHPNVHFVSLNVNESATAASMTDYAKKWNASPHNWWFMHTDTKQLNEWSKTNKIFYQFQKNTGPLAETEPVNHDLGILIFNPQGQLTYKFDLYSDLKLNQQENIQRKKKQAITTIEKLIKSKQP